MGLLHLLEFALKCFDALAWPLFALVYPLYSSIRAIETNSISDTLKLNTYWVVFSLILLFEHAFMKLLEWFPLWLYFRLLVVFWLVIPHFDGAFYVYKHLICPCLSLDLQNVITWFNNRKESLMRENFLSEVERFVKENGPEALEKIVTSKVSLLEPNLTRTEDRFSAMKINEKAIEFVADREILETPPPKKVQKEWTCTVSSLPTQTDTTFDSPLCIDKHKTVYEALKLKNETEPKLTQTESSIVADMEAKEKPVEVATVREDLEFPPEKVQKEWTCALCQVTTTCEKNLNSHLKGSKHKAAYEALKARNPAFVPKMATASTTKTSNHPNKEPVKSTPSSGSKQKVNINENVGGQKNSSPASIAKKPYKPKEQLSDGVSSNVQKRKIAVIVKDKTQSQQEMPNEVPRMKVSRVWCKICGVRCLREIDMLSHLKGKKHKENVQEQQENLNKVARKKPPIWCEICDVYTSEFDISSHLNGRYHRDCLSTLIQVVHKSA
ncbi:hypothetical protein M0R45_008597 [Rubus argutus]|uniref:HVA22-like protein n=1 Tax=Rubus argutus TaxID=59490 RepID=A0AAW1Y2J2_RUBAR